MLEKNGDGTYTIPLSEECPITLKEWQTPHRITPMDDGTEVRTVSIDAPITNQERYEMCGLRWQITASAPPVCSNRRQVSACSWIPCCGTAPMRM